MSLSKEEFEEAVQRAQQAHSVRMTKCLNPECHRNHVVLMDEEGMPFAHFVVPDAWTFVLNGVIQ